MQNVALQCRASKATSLLCLCARSFERTGSGSGRSASGNGNGAQKSTILSEIVVSLAWLCLAWLGFAWLDWARGLSERLRTQRILVVKRCVWSSLQTLVGFGFVGAICGRRSIEIIQLFQSFWRSTF